MAIQVQASVLHGAKDLRIESRSLPAPEPDEVQVQIASTGLCGSDLHYYTHFRNGDILVREPLSLGHESSGIVVDVGSAVTDLKAGDRVALEVGLPCGSCSRCSEGRYNLCPEMRFRSSGKSFPHFQGTLQQRINHPARWCYPLPESLSLDVGALLEPLGVALHSFRRSQLPVAATLAQSTVPASTAPRVLVFGAGAVGLLCAAVAKLRGGANVTIADIDAGRVNWAVSHGFAHHSYVVPMKRGSNIDENLAIAKETASSLSVIGESTSSGEYDAVFECTGVPSCVQASIYATRPGGRVVLVGMGHPVQTLPLGAAALREVDLIGSFRYANTYPDGIAMLEAAAKARKEADKEAVNVPDFAGLVTHRFNGLEEAEKAFAIAGKSTDADGRLVLKVVIDSREVENALQK